MNKTQFVIFFITAFLGGIFGGEFLREKEFFQFLFLIGAGFYFVLIFLKINGCRKDFLRFILLVLLGFLLGIFRFFVNFEEGENHIKNFEGNFTINGCISESVDVRNDKVKYVINSSAVFGEGKWSEVYGKVLVNAPRYPVFEYGDCLMVSGELTAPGQIEEFAYDKYLARYQIYRVMYRANLEKTGEKEGISFLKNIYSLKNVFEKKLSRIYAEPYGSFMAGLVLGSRKGIPAHLMENFNTTGLTHIIAISGYNITMIIVVVSGIFSFLSRRKKVIASMIFIIVFTLMVGASAAVVRASVMGCISLFAIWFGRQYQVSLALLFAAFFMTLWNPFVLVYDVGFQLSFLATGGLIFVSPRLEKYFKWLPEFLGIRQSVLMTLSAQVLALPVIIANFERLSLISPVANLFVLPFIPLAMIAGFFSVVLSGFSQFLGLMAGFLGYLILKLIIFFVEIFASFDFASVEINFFSFWFCGFYYFFLVSILFKPDKYNQPRHPR